MLINDWFGENLKFFKIVEHAVVGSCIYFEVLPPQPAGCEAPPQAPPRREGVALERRCFCVFQHFGFAQCHTSHFFEYRLRRY